MTVQQFESLLRRESYCPAARTPPTRQALLAYIANCDESGLAPHYALAGHLGTVTGINDFIVASKLAAKTTTDEFITLYHDLTNMGRLTR